MYSTLYCLLVDRYLDNNLYIGLGNKKCCLYLIKFNRSNNMKTSFILGMAILFTITGTATADIYYVWDGTSDNWTNGASWDEGVPPNDVSHYAYINKGGTVNITQAGAVAGRVYVGSTGGESGTLNINGGSLTSAGSGILIGYAANSTGTWNMISGTVSGDLQVGISGKGTAFISGGTHTVPTSIYIGYNATGNGSCTISGGSLDIGQRLLLGRDGSTAKFEVNGSSASTITIGDRYYTYSGSPVTLVSRIDNGGISLIHVTGDYAGGTGVATIDGTWTVVGSDAPSGEHTWNILRAANGISGSFDTINIPDLWSWGITTNGSEETLWVKKPEMGIQFTAGFETFNMGSVGTGIGTASNTIDGRWRIVGTIQPDPTITNTPVHTGSRSLQLSRGAGNGANFVGWTTGAEAPFGKPFQVTVWNYIPAGGSWTFRINNYDYIQSLYPVSIVVSTNNIKAWTVSGYTSSNVGIGSGAWGGIRVSVTDWGDGTDTSAGRGSYSVYMNTGSGWSKILSDIRFTSSDLHNNVNAIMFAPQAPDGLSGYIDDVEIFVPPLGTVIIVR